MSEHFTLDELAELDAGVLEGGRSAAAARHLANCDECSARAEAVQKTRARLHDLGPVRIPSDVADRIDRALGDAKATSGEDVVPDAAAFGARRFGGIAPWAYVAAAAIVVLGGVGIAIGTLHHRSSPSSAEAVKEPLVATSAPSAFVQSATGRTYTPDSIAQLAPGLASGTAQSDSALAPTAPRAGAAPGYASAGGTSTRTHSGNESTESAPPPAAAAAPLAAAPATTIPPSLRHLADSRAALLRCAAFITDTANAAPLAVDFGRWTNASAGIHRVPSVIFVFADPDDANTVDVYVVAAACDESSLLDFQVLDKAS